MISSIDALSYYVTQQNSYFISPLIGQVTTRRLDSDSVVTIDNYPQYGDYTVDQLCS